MEHDTDLDAWQREWHRDDVIPSGLQQRVERETRNLRRATYVEIALTVIIGGGMSAWALASRQPIIVALAIGVWFLIGVAWALSFGLRRDILRPSAATTTAFLDLSIRRCRRRLQGLAAQAVLYVLILSFDLVWIYHYLAASHPLEPWTFLTSRRLFLVWVVTLVLLFAAGWYRKRLRRELQNLLALQRQLGDPDR